MSEDINFPEPRTFKCLDYSDRFTGLSPREVKNWVRSCMEDKPSKGISRYPNLDKTPNELLDIVIEWKGWYNKWFDQFEEDLGE